MVRHTLPKRKAEIQILGEMMDVHHWWILMQAKLKSGTSPAQEWRQHLVFVRLSWSPKTKHKYQPHTTPGRPNSTTAHRRTVGNDGQSMIWKEVKALKCLVNSTQTSILFSLSASLFSFFCRGSDGTKSVHRLTVNGSLRDYHARPIETLCDPMSLRIFGSWMPFSPSACSGPSGCWLCPFYYSHSWYV